MFILKETHRRCNPHAPYVDAAGTRYPRMPAELYEEIAEPAAPEDYSADTYYRTESDDAPYVIYTKKSDEEIMALMVQRYEQALDGHLDSVAKQYSYNDRFTFALRAGYAGPWQAEGIAFAQWMDTCNADAFTLIQKVIAGEVPAPTIEEFIGGLPEFNPVPSE